LFQVYGIEIGKQMIETQFLDGEYALKGFISPTSLTRANRKEIIFFMNGRWIQDANLTTAFLQGYHSFLMVGRYPMGIIFLTIPAEDVDINVHPTKTSVRFQQPDRIFGLVRGAVKKTLSAKSPFPEVNFPVWEWKAHAETNSTIEFHKDPKDEIKKSSLINPGMVPPISGVGTRASLEGLHSLPLLRVIGQVALAYIITEGPDGLYLIDQHAAHERVLFEKFISQIGTNHLSQSLLEAYKVEIPVTKISIVPEILPILQHLGFSIEPFGGSAFLVRAIPALFTGIDPGRLFLSMIEEFEEDETPLAQELENKLAARICKRAAIKAGKSLTIEEQRRLVEDLEACKKPHHCPHGRPTMIHLSASLLEKQFGRR
jgi:DNA mismatch repair protein MutL